MGCCANAHAFAAYGACALPAATRCRARTPLLRRAALLHWFSFALGSRGGVKLRGGRRRHFAGAATFGPQRHRFYFLGVSALLPGAALRWLPSFWGLRLRWRHYAAVVLLFSILKE